MNNATKLLKRALEALDQNKVEPMLSLQEDILTFLATEPEAEPVAYTNEAQLNYLKNPRYRNNSMSMWASVNENVDIPLYTIFKPTRKPLTSNERLQGFIELRDKDDGAHLLSFLNGICFAEEHHKIGNEE